MLRQQKQSALERSEALDALRKEWEHKHGVIKPGRPLADEPSFYSKVYEETLISRRAALMLMKIARGLAPEVKLALAGTPVSFNQKQLLDLAAMKPKEQMAVAATIKRGHEAKAVIAAMGADDTEYMDFLSHWELLSDSNKLRFVQVVMQAVNSG